MSEAQEIANPQWLPISNLRRAKYNYSGWSYTYEWTKSNNLLEYANGGFNMPIKTRFVLEPIEIRKNAEGGIEYRLTKRTNREAPHVYDTIFGKYYSYDHGEFGGELILPSGKEITGNFRHLFEFDNKVYAVDSLNHLGLSHFKLYEFLDSTTYRCLYDVGGFGERNEESLEYQGIFISQNIMYLLIDGVFWPKKNNASDKFPLRRISRLLSVSNGIVKECIEMEEAFAGVNNIIIVKNLLYVAADKILAVVDINTGKKQFYTFLRQSAIHDLLKVRKLRGY